MLTHDPFGVSGRTIWVTGAGRGIGLDVALLFRDLGAHVVGIDRTVTPELKAIAKHAYEVDIANHEAVGKFALEVAGHSLVPDILVNNAGITRDSVIWKMPPEQWDAVLNTCLRGAYSMIHHAVPLMRQHSRPATIVNIASINGERGKFGQTNYAAAKAGLIGLTKSAARELGAFGIRINAIAPGMVETEMALTLPASVRAAALQETLLGRLASPRDIANAVLFLASPLASHITGHVLRVDGGQYL